MLTVLRAGTGLLRIQLRCSGFQKRPNYSPLASSATKRRNKTPEDVGLANGVSGNRSSPFRLDCGASAVYLTCAALVAHIWHSAEQRRAAPGFGSPIGMQLPPHQRLWQVGIRQCVPNGLASPRQSDVFRLNARHGPQMPREVALI